MVVGVAVPALALALGGETPACAIAVIGALVGAWVIRVAFVGLAHPNAPRHPSPARADWMPAR